MIDKQYSNKSKNRITQKRKWDVLHVSEKEMTLYRRLRLPRWKDRLPQFNPEFDKRHLAASLTPAYLRGISGRYLPRRNYPRAHRPAGLFLPVFLPAV